MEKPTEQYILDHIKVLKRSLQKDYPEFYEILDHNNLAESVYLQYHDQTYCKYCGSKTKFISFRKGYSQYCSRKCVSNDCIAKVKQIKQERYGDEHYTNIAKRRKTNFIKYNDSNFTNQHKAALTKLERYGNASYNNTTQAVITKKQKYKTWPNGAATNRLNRVLRNKLIGYEGQNWIMPCPHPECNKCKGSYIISPVMYHDRTKRGCEVCTRLFKPGTIGNVSNISSIYFDKIDPEGLGTREKRIGKYIVDWIYKDTIIEFYGDYWHANPAFYEPDWVHPVLKKTAAEIWQKDLERINFLIDAGYDVKIIWESEVE